MSVPPIAFVVIFLATFLAAEGLLLLFGGQSASRKARASKRLRQLASRLDVPDAGSRETLLRDQGRGWIDSLQHLLPGSRSLELRLYRAGMGTTPSRFLMLSLGLGAAGFVAGLIFWQDTVAGLMLAFVGLVPWIQSGRLGSRRRKRFEEQFPEALELMTRALRAGHSLMFGFQLIGEEMPDPVGREFAHLSEEVKLGQELGVALSNLAYRSGVDDIPYFTTAVMVQRETGGNLADLLDTLCYVIRDRFKLFGKVRSMTAVGKATANILGLWPLLIVGMLHLVGADFVSLLWETPAGHLLSLGAGILVVVGYIGCRRAAEIRV